MDSSQHNDYIQFRYSSPYTDINAVLCVRVKQGTTYSAYIHEQGEFYNERIYVCFTGEIEYVGRLVRVGTTLGWFNLTKPQYLILYELLLNVITFTPAKE